MRFCAKPGKSGYAIPGKRLAMRLQGCARPKSGGAADLAYFAAPLPSGEVAAGGGEEGAGPVCNATQLPMK